MSALIRILGLASLLGGLALLGGSWYLGSGSAPLPPASGDDPRPTAADVGAPLAGRPPRAEDKELPELGLPDDLEQRLAEQARRETALPAEVRLALHLPPAQGDKLQREQAAAAALARCLAGDFGEEPLPDRHPHAAPASPHYRDLGFLLLFPGPRPFALPGHPAAPEGSTAIAPELARALQEQACALHQTADGPAVLRRMMAYPAAEPSPEAWQQRLELLRRRAALDRLREETIPAAMVQNGHAPPASVPPREPAGTMVRLAGGVFWAGSSEAQIDERVRYFKKYVEAHVGPARREAYEDEVLHPVQVRPFSLDRREVTVAQFRAFVRSSGYRPDPAAIAPELRGDLPVTRVNLADATAYCQGRGARLPGAMEWEFAARGVEGRRFPWGEGFPNGSRANFCDKRCPKPWGTPEFDDSHAGLAPVGSYPAGATPEGIFDLSGNAREWTATLLPDGRALVKGGGYHNAYEDMLPADVRANHWHLRLPDVGFRCARDGEGPR